LPTACLAREPATFSIVAAVPNADGVFELGGAVATRRPAVGSRLPAVRPGIAAVASQAVSNPWLAVLATDLLAAGVDPRTAVTSALGADPHPELRQLHVVTADGRIAAHTGAATPDWHGHRAGIGVSVAANHVAGPGVVDGMLAAFEATSGDLAERLMAAIEAGDAAGGDARGKQSAALKVYRSEPFPWIDLRVDDHVEPIIELRRLLSLYRAERQRRIRPLSDYLKQ
jgi:uncharacterized Ntn-hydrolase superfamily protein